MNGYQNNSLQKLVRNKRYRRNKGVTKYTICELQYHN